MQLKSRAPFHLPSGLLLVFLLAGIALPGDAEERPDVEQKPWARKPADVGFQNESHWQDNRWQQTDVGPYLTGAIVAPGGPVLKGMAIRVGEDRSGAIVFDSAQMTYRTMWTGDFLAFGPRRFGLIEKPQVAGDDVWSVLPDQAGWAHGGTFDTSGVELGWPGGIVGLPKSWAHYKGLYQCGQRVVLHYTVGDVEVLDSPWMVRAGESRGFTRDLYVEASDEPLQVRLAGANAAPILIGNSDGRIEVTEDAVSVLHIPPRSAPRNYRILVVRPTAMEQDRQSLARQALGEPLPQQLRDSQTELWKQVLTTTGEVSADDAPYVIDTLTIPFENPWNALFFTSGHDFFSDGSAAICTAHGDVWVVTGIDSQLNDLRWKRYATGIYQPLGLKIVEDKVYVLGRNQVTRLHDRNGDGEADHYENFNNDLLVTGGDHDYATCLDTDPDGNFYFIHARSGVMRLSADGQHLSSVADGFRNPNGMSVGPDGTITASPQEGNWTPASNITIVKPEGYYGFGGPRVTESRPQGYDLPMCYLPRAFDTSSGAQTWVTSDRWGPLSGQMLHFSYGLCQMLLAFGETVDGVEQGGAVRFPTSPADFESGAMRGRFRSHDGQLYVSGLRGWQTAAVRDGCFQRVRYTGQPVHLPAGMQTFRNGVKLSFTGELDPLSVQDPSSYFIEQWNYRWSENYGSPELKPSEPGATGRDEVPLRSATLTDDGRGIFLEIPDLQPVDQMQITWTISAADGTRLRQTFAGTFHRIPDQVFPEDQITRVEPQRTVSPEVQQRLVPGVPMAFQTTGPSAAGRQDTRIERMLTLYQPTGQPAATFLAPGPFKLAADGYLKLDVTDYYQFSIEGNGSASLQLNDDVLLPMQPINGQTASSDEIVLRRGLNRVQVRYHSPESGTARMRVLWKNGDRPWDTLPASLFYHDPLEPDAVQGRQLRSGRELVRSHRCASCHLGMSLGGPESAAMQAADLAMQGPDLTAAGVRLTDAWLYRWLLDPHALRSDAHMPALLGDPDSPSTRQTAADIVAYLSQDPATATASSAEAAVDEDLGATLYEQQGCISCHRLTPAAQPDPLDRVSLHFAASKFEPGALSAYLKNPQAHYIANPMPRFRLSGEEARSLARYIRSEAGELDGTVPAGDPQRGKAAFVAHRCGACHSRSAAGEGEARLVREESVTDVPVRRVSTDVGCLAPARSESNAPHFALTAEERRDVAMFLTSDIQTPSREHPAETSRRLFTQLRCAACHDRDAARSQLPLLVATEGSGVPLKAPPSLTWVGEKLYPQWTRQFLAGEIAGPLRPWLETRMPAFPAFADAVAHGFALSHGIDPEGRVEYESDPRLVELGRELTTSRGLDCRQCHGIGDLEPRGDEKTQIHLGINFAFIRDRMRPDFYQRFMLDPPRYDPGTNMPTLSVDGRRTKVREILDRDARAQFNAIWHYIQSGQWP